MIASLFARIEQSLERKQCNFSSNEPVTRNLVRNESPCYCESKNRWPRDLVGDVMKLISLCLTLALLCVRAFASEMTPAASPSHFTSFAQALAEAKRVVDTDPGKAYDVEFSMAIAPRLGEIVGECTKNSGPRLVFDIVFVFFANDDHVFVVSTEAKSKIDQIAECKDLWERLKKESDAASAADQASERKDEKPTDDMQREKKDFRAYCRCFEQRAKMEPYFKQLTKQAQNLVDSLQKQLPR